MNNGHTVITFGKHNGKNYEEVRASDVAYCNWILKQLEVAGRLRAFQDWLKQTATHKATCEMCNGCGQVAVI